MYFVLGLSCKANGVNAKNITSKQTWEQVNHASVKANKQKNTGHSPPNSTPNSQGRPSYLSRIAHRYPITLFPSFYTIRSIFTRNWNYYALVGKTARIYALAHWTILPTQPQKKTVETRYRRYRSSSRSCHKSVSVLLGYRVTAQVRV